LDTFLNAGSHKRSPLDPDKPGKVAAVNYQRVLAWCSEMCSERRRDECGEVVVDEIL
jgi:hypothetical protein